MQQNIKQTTFYCKQSSLSVFMLKVLVKEVRAQVVVNKLQIGDVSFQLVDGLCLLMKVLARYEVLKLFECKFCSVFDGFCLIK